MGARVRAALLALAALLVAGCDGPPSAEAALTPFEQLAADSAAADSAAFATLPPALQEFLDVRAALDELPADRCEILPARQAHELRRRAAFRFADSSRALLYAVADDSSGALLRVEFVRRTPLRGQRGLIWDGEQDRTTSTWWTETRWGLSRRVERGDVPRGGPLPRALRGLGRQLLLVACAGAVDSAAPTPP